MSRAPYNVLVLPFRKKDKYEFAVFKRSDMKIWQFISGGGEENEVPLTAAIRESLEESGIPVNSKYYLLDSIFSVTADNFQAARKHWPADLYAIPNHCYAVDAGESEIILSNEHTEYKWSSYEECNNLLHFNSNQCALWELHERLIGGHLRSAAIPN